MDYYGTLLVCVLGVGTSLLTLVSLIEAWQKRGIMSQR